MNSLSVFLKDLGAAVKKPKVFIPIIVVLFVPVLYSGMFLTAFWDPYGKMDELPVAVVNEDKGAEMNGTALQVGADLVAELKKSDDFGWKFVSESEAEEGMKDKKYYMSITIPEDFSQKATTVLDENPQPASIIFEPNEGYNFLAAQIGGSAIKELKSKVSAEVTEAYTQTLLDQVEKISGGLGDAGSGAASLNEGAVKLGDGAATLTDKLGELTSGAGKLADGITTLAKGAQSLGQGSKSLQSGAAGLAGGLSQLSAAERQLESGADSVRKGGADLQSGLKASLAGAQSLQSGLTAAKAGGDKLEAGLEQSYGGSAKVTDGAKGLEAGLEQFAAVSPELAASPQFQQLLAASQAVAAGSEQVTEAQQQLLSGSKELQQAHQQLLGGSGQLTAAQQLLLAGAGQLNAGHEQLAAGLKQFGGKLAEASAGGKQLAAGAASLEGGVSSLNAGVNQLSGGVGTLYSGSQQLLSGAGTLKEGMASLTEGSGELASKLSDAARQTSGVKATDAVTQMYAQPIQIQEKIMNEVPNYGTGFAPYFLSLGLFVGALITTLVIPLRGSTVEESSGLNHFVSRTLSFMGMGLIQSLFAILLVLYGLGLKVQNVPLFYLFTFAVSLCFMFIIQAIVTWLDQPGRFVAILLLIFQLTTSAGTFPLELIPSWMKGFNPWLPMTYSVSGYKAVISSGNMTAIWDNIGMLAAFGGVFLLFTLGYFLSHKHARETVQEAVISA